VFQTDPSGCRATISAEVDSTNTASAVGSGGVDVFSTPSLVCLMERAARDAVQEHLLPGLATIGVRLDIRHLSATPTGEMITATAELLEVDGRRLVFAVSARDRLGPVGEGRHERQIVRLESFIGRVRERFDTAGLAAEKEPCNG
jgi:fluoroacetyl-CoA thioesterase